MLMRLVKIRYSGTAVSWTVVDNDGETVAPIRDWIVHLEETNLSPNTVVAYARHMARLGRYLNATEKTLTEITVSDYDHFLQWLPYALAAEDKNLPENIVQFDTQSLHKLSPSLKNQIHLATKSFYRYLQGRDPFEQVYGKKSQHHQGVNSYKPFLEHINNRRTTKRKDRYLRGDLGKVQKDITEKRLSPEKVLLVIKACHKIRDAFLVALLYNTGMRIGEALGLRHTDIDLENRVIWVIPRDDNENGARAKSQRARGIPVMDYLLNMYEDFITSDEYQGAFEAGTEYVFCNVERGKVGRALSRSYAENLKAYLKKRTGINFTWHHFRHTHASEAIADGYGLLQVADRLGHASPQTTVDFYKHLFSHEIRKLYLSGPNMLEKRLEEFRKLVNTTDRGIKWI